MKRVFLATVLCVVNAVGLCACQGHNNGASTQNMQVMPAETGSTVEV